MIITTLNGQSEQLTDYTIAARRRRVNGEYSLSFLLFKTELNEHSFPLVLEETTIEYEGVTYRIKDINERLVGNTPVKEVRAEHTFFDVIDVYQYNTLTRGYKSINETLNFTLQGTGYTFSVIDSFSTVEFENFGNDNVLSLFKTILERYQAEYEVIGKDVRIRKQIGNKTDNQFRYNHNIKTFAKNINTDNLSTYIRGFGKQNEDGSYVVTAEYTSPNSAIFGIRNAKPVYNETFTIYESLLEHIKSKLIDTPEISMTVEFVDDVPGLGDEWYLIYEPLNIDIAVRILEIEDYPESKQSPRVTLANHIESFADVVFRHTKSQLDKLWDENSKKIRYNVLDEAVQRATEALNNSLTELEYPPNMGIVARDPNDPNRFVAVRSSGIGVTTNGGATFPNAITPDGVVTELLTAGQIKTNNVQIIGKDNLFYWDGDQLIAISESDSNKYTRLNSNGLYIAKGALNIERPDGALFMQNGIMKNDFSVQEHYPPFKRDSEVSIVDYWCRSLSDVYVPINYYSIYHNSRYLKMVVGLKSTGGNHSYFKFTEEGGGASAETYEYRWEDYAGYFKELTIDLGVPTYTRRYFVAQMKTVDPARYGYARILRLWTEG